jgi:hypothetical protein
VCLQVFFLCVVWNSSKLSGVLHTQGRQVWQDCGTVLLQMILVSEGFRVLCPVPSLAW